ncbi:MAG: sialate O-acetylesterase [Gemmatimonadaceae bacterium]
MHGRSMMLALAALAALAPALPTGSARAQLRTSRLVGDGMVMQRGASVPVWGAAAPGDSVVVTFDGRRHATRADAAGAWRVTLPSMRAGGPHEMTIAARGEQLRVRDILVGDVWVASGQSNMEWTVANANDAPRETAAATDRGIRHFKVPQSWAEEPSGELAGGAWVAADPRTVGEFTAIGYFFARELRKTAAAGVPIGIINTTWGGSRIEPWMSSEALGFDQARWDSVKAEERAAQQRTLDRLRERLGGELPKADAGLVNGQALWADPALDDAAWATIAVPGQWEPAGWEGLDGVAWYRTSFELTPAEAAQGVRLGLGQIDDSDVSWVNGVEVGRLDNGWNVPRAYAVPAAALRPGRNVVAVRVEDFQGGGGIAGDPSQVFLEVGGVRRPLPAAWKFRVARVREDVEGQKNQVPTLLYNKMIHPLLPYPIKGAIWYQGESNAYPEGAIAYRKQFADMITDWRRRWGVGDFPFLWVSLANYQKADAEPASDHASAGWALLREAQHRALALPSTGEAIAIDVGEAGDIHPRNKQEVGRRLALAARRVAHGEHALVASGPAYRSHRVEGGRVVLDFDGVGGGLVVGRRPDAGAEGEPATGAAPAPAGALKGFAIAGPDLRFVWADARIEGNRVVVWSDRVPNPVAVRYAWGNNPSTANLYNRAGLPAAPFRTDEW